MDIIGQGIGDERRTNHVWYGHRVIALFDTSFHLQRTPSQLQTASIFPTPVDPHMAVDLHRNDLLSLVPAPTT